MPEYQPTIEYRGLTWTHDPDGEYGEYSATYKGRKLTVSTNIEGDEWDYMIDDGEFRVADEPTVRCAMRNAMEEVDG